MLKDFLATAFRSIFLKRGIFISRVIEKNRLDDFSGLFRRIRCPMS
jgi:hypothetical protein